MLDSQYSRVIRWVNRAQTMSAGGKYSDAILDVECARAELDDARQELLLCHKSGSERKRIPAPALALLTAFCAVFFMASPLQRAQLPADGTASSGISLRALETEAMEVGKNVLFAGEGSSDDRPEEGNKSSSYAVELDSGEGVSEEDVFRLIEVGRRALQKGEVSSALDFN